MAGAKEGVVFARNGIENTGFAYAFSLIEGKYKLPVLFACTWTARRATTSSNASLRLLLTSRSPLR